MNEKLKEYKEKKNNSQQEYESVLIKYENDIRGHIKIESQLKILVDELQWDLDECKNEKKKLYNKINILKNYIKNQFNNNNQTNNYNEYNEINKINEKNILNLEEEINNLKIDIKNKEILLKSYEEQNLKLISNEKNLKTLMIINEKNDFDKEEKYKKQIHEMNKKLSFYRDLVKKRYNTNNENNKNNQSLSSTPKEEKKNINSENLNRKNRNNSISYLNISQSIDKKYQNQLSNNTKIHSLSNQNLSKDNSNSTIINSKNQNKYLTKLLINNTIVLTNKRNNGVYNKYKSFGNMSKPIKTKNSTIYKDFIINSNYVKYTKEKMKKFKHLRSLSQGKINKNIEFINNINIYTNSVKTDKFNTYRGNSSNGSIKNSNNSLSNISRRNKSKVKYTNSTLK